MLLIDPSQDRFIVKETPLGGRQTLPRSPILLMRQSALKESKTQSPSSSLDFLFTEETS